MEQNIDITVLSDLDVFHAPPFPSQSSKNKPG